MEALMAKQMCRAAFVALCMLGIATACAVKVPVSDFPPMMLVSPDNPDSEQK